MNISFISAYILAISCLFLYEASAQPDTLGIIRHSMEEVNIVSARELSSLNEMAASATHISFDRAENGSIYSLADLSSMVPNLFMPDYGSRLTSPLYIRGIGSRINSPSIGLYVDNVPYFEKSAFNYDLFEINRIEILRGPQGTMHGRNTMGGIITVHSVSPIDFQGTRVNLSGGNYGLFRTGISHYSKPDDNNAFSIGLNYNSNSGYFTNEYTGEKADNIQSAGGRIRYIRQITERTKAELISSYENSKEGGYPYAIFDPNENYSESVNYNRPSSYNREIMSNSLLIEHINTKFQIRSVTSNQISDDIQSIDQDFTQLDMFYAEQKEKQFMLSQEIIAKSTGEGNYGWISGLFGFIQNIDRELDLEYGDDFLNSQNIPFSMSDSRVYEHRTGGIALFHQSGIKNFLINNMTFSTGLRLDYEKSELDYNSTRTLNNNETPTGEFSSSLDFVKVVPKISLQYFYSDNSQIYFTVAGGYKTGGFNVTFEREEDRTFDPEQSINYEAGIKTRLFSNRLFLNGALYYIDWSNQQIYQPVPSGQGSMLKNAGKSVSKGGELELRALPARNIEAFAGYGYTNAKFTDHQPRPGTNYDGNYIPYVPKHTFNMGVKWNKEIKSRIIDNIFAYTNLRYTGKHYWNESNSHHQNGYSILNAQFSILKDNLQIDLWAKNILQSNYYSFFFQALGNGYVQNSKPMTIGVNVSFSF